MHLGAERFVHGQQNVVHDQIAVARMVRDERKFIRMEPEIQRVHHAARCRNAEVALEMRRVVPHQRRHAITPVHPREFECPCQPPRPAIHVAVRAARERAVRAARNNLDSVRSSFPARSSMGTSVSGKSIIVPRIGSPPKGTRAHPTTNRASHAAAHGRPRDADASCHWQWLTAGSSCSKMLLSCWGARFSPE